MPQKILFVDDDADVVDIVKSRLENNHYDVITADNGKDGIRLAREERPDLIMMDILMPGMSGGEAVRQLQEDNLTKDIPTIFLTSLSYEEPNDTEGDKININGHYFTAIPKPFKSERMLAVINGIINNE